MGVHTPILETDTFGQHLDSRRGHQGCPLYGAPAETRPSLETHLADLCDALTADQDWQASYIDCACHSTRRRE